MIIFYDEALFSKKMAHYLLEFDMDIIVYYNMVGGKYLGIIVPV